MGVGKRAQKPPNEFSGKLRAVILPLTAFDCLAMNWVLFIVLTQMLGANCPEHFADFIRGTPEAGMDTICTSPMTHAYAFKTKAQCEHAATRALKTLKKLGHVDYVCFNSSEQLDENWME